MPTPVSGVAGGVRRVSIDSATMRSESGPSALPLEPFQKREQWGDAPVLLWLPSPAPEVRGKAATQMLLSSTAVFKVPQDFTLCACRETPAQMLPSSTAVFKVPL